MKADKTGKSYIRPALLGAAIIAVFFSHFSVSQFIFFQKEKETVITEAIIRRPVEVKTKLEAKKTDIATTPQRAAVVSPPPETDRIMPRQTAMKQTVTRKKEAPRESRTERLRRAEKLLTGI